MRHSLQRVLILAIAVIVSAGPLASSAYDVRYWVWQRDDPLDEQELAELEAQKIDTIYWQAGELENTRETWRWKSAIQFPIVQHRAHPFRACGAAGFERATTVFRWIDHGASAALPATLLKRPTAFQHSRSAAS